jgi:hypothetical protein
MTAWIIMIWTFGMLTPNIGGEVLILGSLLIYLYIVLELLYAERCVAAPSAARTQPNDAVKIMDQR